MKLTYNVSMNDLEEFAHFFYKTNLKTKKINYIFFTIIYVLIFFIFFSDDKISIDVIIINVITYIVTIGLYAFFSFFLWPKIIYWFYKRQIRKGDLKSLFGDFILEIKDDCLISSANKIESKIPFEYIINIQETEKYFFIFVSANCAYVVNKSKSSGDVEDVFNYLREKSEKIKK